MTHKIYLLAIASSSYLAPILRPAPTLAPLKQQIDRMKDPRLVIASINEAHQNLLIDETISEADKKVLIDVNRQDYAKLRGVQRQQAMKRVEGLPLVLNRLIASFIYGGFYYDEDVEKTMCSLGVNAYSMVMKPIKSMYDAWSFCEWTQDNKHVLYIPRESRILHCVDVDRDKPVNCCHIPTSIGKIASLDGSIAGFALVTGEHGALLWNGTTEQAYHHDTAEFIAMLKVLPPYTIYARQFKDRLQVYFDAGVQGNSIKTITLVEDQAKDTYKFVLGQQRKKCVVVSKNLITIYSALDDRIQKIVCAEEICKAMGDAPESVSLPEVGNDIMLYGKKHAGVLRIDSEAEYDITDIVTVNQFIKEGHANEAGTMAAWLIQPSRHVIIQRIKDNSAINTPAIGGVGANHIRFRGGRLLSSFASSWTETRRPVVVDVADVVHIATCFTVAQVDLMDSLCREVYLLRQINERLSQHKRFKINFTKKQAAIWLTIPKKLRNQFMTQVGNELCSNFGKNVKKVNKK